MISLNTRYIVSTIKYLLRLSKAYRFLGIKVYKSILNNLYLFKISSRVSKLIDKNSKDLSIRNEKLLEYVYLATIHKYESVDHLEYWLDNNSDISDEHKNMMIADIVASVNFDFIKFGLLIRDLKEDNYLRGLANLIDNYLYENNIYEKIEWRDKNGKIQTR